MKLRSFFQILVAVAIGLLLTAAVGFYWLTSQSPLALLRGGAIANPTAAMFVPKQSPVMVSLLVNPDRLEAFRQLVARPGNRRRSRTELDQIEQTLLGNTDLDYRRDIQPWLGEEITLAVTSLDFDRDRQNGAQPGYLLAVTTKDAERSREFLQLFYSQQALAGTYELAFEQYKGVNLIYRRPLAEAVANNGNLPSTLTSAVIGDRFVLFANSPKVLRSAINNVQVESLSLINSPVYQQSLQNLTKPRIGLSFVNLPAIAAWIANEPNPELEPSQVPQTLTIGLALDKQGLVAETALQGTSAEDTKLTLSEPVKALEYIPQEAALAVAGVDLNQLWTRLSAGATQDDLSQLLKQSIASLESRWNVDLAKDIFSFVEGEYALSLLPRSDRVNPDWIFVAEKTAGADAKIEHLDHLAKEEGFSVGNLSVGDQTITAWTKLITTTKLVPSQDDGLMKLEAQVRGVHAEVDNYEVFATSIEAMAEALEGRSNSLVAQEKFQTAIAPLPPPNNGYFYLDWNSAQPAVERQLPVIRFAELAGKPLFDHLRSLSISSYGSTDGVQRSKLFFRLGNANAT